MQPFSHFQASLPLVLCIGRIMNTYEDNTLFLKPLHLLKSDDYKVVDIKSLAKCQIITKVYKGLTVKCLGQLSGMCQVSVRINPVCAQPL